MWNNKIDKIECETINNNCDKIVNNNCDKIVNNNCGKIVNNNCDKIVNNNCDKFVKWFKNTLTVIYVIVQTNWHLYMQSYTWKKQKKTIWFFLSYNRFILYFCMCLYACVYFNISTCIQTHTRPL